MNNTEGIHTTRYMSQQLSRGGFYSFLAARRQEWVPGALALLTHPPATLLHAVERLTSKNSAMLANRCRIGTSQKCLSSGMEVPWMATLLTASASRLWNSVTNAWSLARSALSLNKPAVFRV